MMIIGITYGLFNCHREPLSGAETIELRQTEMPPP